MTRSPTMRVVKRWLVGSCRCEALEAKARSEVREILPGGGWRSLSKGASRIRQSRSFLSCSGWERVPKAPAGGSPGTRKSAETHQSLTRTEVALPYLDVSKEIRWKARWLTGLKLQLADESRFFIHGLEVISRRLDALFQARLRSIALAKTT